MDVVDIIWRRIASDMQSHFIDVYFHVYNSTHTCSLHILVLLIPFERYRLGNKLFSLNHPRNIRQIDVTRSDVGRSLF